MCRRWFHSSPSLPSSLPPPPSSSPFQSPPCTQPGELWEEGIIPCRFFLCGVVFAYNWKLGWVSWWRVCSWWWSDGATGAGEEEAVVPPWPLEQGGGLLGGKRERGEKSPVSSSQSAITAGQSKWPRDHQRGEMFFLLDCRNCYFFWSVCTACVHLCLRKKRMPNIWTVWAHTHKKNI